MSIYAAVLRLMHASSMVHIVPSAELPPATSQGDGMKIFIFGRGCIRHGACAPITFVIVEDYLFHSKFHFTGFDVNANQLWLALWTTPCISRIFLREYWL